MAYVTSPAASFIPWPNSRTPKHKRANKLPAYATCLIFESAANDDAAAAAAGDCGVCAGGCGGSGGDRCCSRRSPGGGEGVRMDEDRGRRKLSGLNEWKNDGFL